MKLALIQLTVEDNIEENFIKVKKFLSETISSKSDFILLPECFLYLSNNKEDSIKNALPLNNKYIIFFKQFSKDNKVLLLLGSLAIRSDNKIYNCSFLIDRNG